jgi:regulator of replication initiation timing
LLNITENQELRAKLSGLHTKYAKLKQQNTDISEELESLKADLKSLMEINTAFGAENEKLKRQINENEGDVDESAKVAHLSKKVKSSTKGKKAIRIGDDDYDDDIMDVESNATEEQAELAEEPNEKSARVR